MESAPRALRCPLCCETFVCQSEQECEAHIASCSRFHAEFGEQSQRGGLVSGFGDATSGATGPGDNNRPANPPAAAAPAAAAPATGLESACDAYAALLALLVPIARETKSLDETVDMIVQLASVLVAHTNGGGHHGTTEGVDVSDDFGFDELLTVTLDPYLRELPNGAHVRASLAPAVDAVRRASAPSSSGGGGGSGPVAEALRGALMWRVAGAAEGESLGVPMSALALRDH